MREGGKERERGKFELGEKKIGRDYKEIKEEGKVLGEGEIIRATIEKCSTDYNCTCFNLFMTVLYCSVSNGTNSLGSEFRLNSRGGLW